MPKGGRDINRCKMISIVSNWTNALREYKIPIGLTIAIMAFTMACRTYYIIVMIYKQVMRT